MLRELSKQGLGKGTLSFTGWIKGNRRENKVRKRRKEQSFMQCIRVGSAKEQMWGQTRTGH